MITTGIIGLGTIGIKVAEICNSLGMNVIQNLESRFNYINAL